MTQFGGTDGKTYYSPTALTTPEFSTDFNWLSNSTEGASNQGKAGEMVLVTVYPKTGTVVTKPVAAPVSGNREAPYQFAKDAINSGL